MYSRKALQELREREALKPPAGAAIAAPSDMADLPPDIPIDDGVACGFYDDELKRFVSPETWMRRQAGRQPAE